MVDNIAYTKFRKNLTSDAAYFVVAIVTGILSPFMVFFWHPHQYLGSDDNFELLKISKSKFYQKLQQKTQKVLFPF